MNKSAKDDKHNKPPIKPLVLCILDGWGERKSHENNAIYAANTPCFDGLVKGWPRTTLEASEHHVGLPDGQMGNSEVGHMTIGAGRVIMQDLPRISHALATGDLKANPIINKAIDDLKTSGGALHLMGLTSDGGVHSHVNHLIGLAKIFNQAGITVFAHIWTDGRDTAPASAIKMVDKLLDEAPFIIPATLSGRYYVMDRDKRWERVRPAYEAMIEGKSEERYGDIKTVIQKSYETGKMDEFIYPTVLGSYQGIAENDIALMANFRADRVRQITHALAHPDFDGFDLSPRRFKHIITMTAYEESLNPFVEVLFPPETPKNYLGEMISKAGLTQLRIAETEKYAHVTYFMNGGQEDCFNGEEQRLIPSPNVATYDLKPEMSAFEMTDKLLEAIEKDSYDVIIMNYANADMVGHTGDFKAAVKAIEAVDQCLARLVPVILNKGGVMLITADHGNAEKMLDEETKAPHTAHTTELVPFIMVGLNKDNLGNKKGGYSLNKGSLADIAPTMLGLLGIKQPAEMTGKQLFFAK